MNETFFSSELQNESDGDGEDREKKPKMSNFKSV